MTRKIPGGFLVAVEGIDGAGKSVQVREVSRVLQARGLDCVVTHEPTDGPWGQKIRQSALTGRLSPAEELHAFMEDRKQHVTEVIKPALAQGKIVITDRYYFSTVAYQGARGFNPEQLLKENEEIAVEPNLLIIIDVDPATALARIGSRDGRTNDFETLAQQTRSRNIFLSIRKPYLVLLDGSRPSLELRDEILVAFSRFAVMRLATLPGLTARQRLDAILAI
ncbi:MAG: dTMP kinase, partial [Verrucomicrobiae bacterium]|nr:dTMP kinase [Verrucomicrobiae bacterium]